MRSVSAFIGTTLKQIKKININEALQCPFNISQHHQTFHSIPDGLKQKSIIAKDSLTLHNI